MMNYPFGFAANRESIVLEPLATVDSDRDVVGEFHNLKQTTTVAEYQEKFEELRDLMSKMNYGLSESYLISSFLSGLKQEIKLSVRYLRPETLYHAFNLARIQEIALEERKDKLPNAGLLRDPRIQPPLGFQYAAIRPEPKVWVPRNSPGSVRLRHGTSRQLSSQAASLVWVLLEMFDLVLMNPTFCEAYANSCYQLAYISPDLSVDGENWPFKRLLLNKCQEEFERGEREQEEAKKANVECEAHQSEEERKEKQLQERRRMLGNLRLIGELYKKRMLTERIMHECIKKLLGQSKTLDEAGIEGLCTLMSTIGEMIDHPKAKEHMDVYFDVMEKLSNNMKLSSRARFMLKAVIDLRNNKW